jgi:hypothetical protein
MSINRSMIDSAILAIIIWFMRRDLVLALAIAVASYILRMLSF